MAKNSGLGKGLDALFAAPIALEGLTKKNKKLMKEMAKQLNLLRLLTLSLIQRRQERNLILKV